MNIINEDLQISFKLSKGFRYHIRGDKTKLLQKQRITKCDINEGDYFLSLFVHAKKDGSFQTILNLKYLNKECFKYHSKMETIGQVIHTILPNCYLASLDIKDTF